MLLFCAVSDNCDNVKCCIFTLCSSNISQALCCIVCALLLSPSILSPDVILSAKGPLACMLSQIQLWGQEMDFCSVFSAHHLRAERYSRAAAYEKPVQDYAHVKGVLGRRFYNSIERHRSSCNTTWCCKFCHHALGAGVMVLLG